jgi:folate-binding protein YgfZ
MTPGHTGQHSILIPALASASYEAARHRAAFMDRSSRGRILVSGRDNAAYLQGLLTNDIVALPKGQGCYAAYLTAQGRMITDLWVYQLGDVILLMVAGGVKDALLARLDALVFSEDVQLDDVTERFAQIAIIGPRSASIVGSLLKSGTTVLDALTDHGNMRMNWEGRQAVVTRVSDLGEPGFELYVERGDAETGFDRPIIDALRQHDVPELDDQAAEAIRIEAGVPLFHRDMDEETIPLEAGIEARAISQTKGCYVGQEVIVRVLHRGHGRVARRLVGLQLSVGPDSADKSVPKAGARVLATDREIGHVTSAAFSPALKRPIALAYLQRDFVQPGTHVSVEGTSAEVRALPFV